jgi:hypothetical protein
MFTVYVLDSYQMGAHLPFHPPGFAFYVFVYNYKYIIIIIMFLRVTSYYLCFRLLFVIYLFYSCVCGISVTGWQLLHKHMNNK